MERLLSVAEAAELLGMTKGGVYMAIQRRELPAVRLGKRRLRFRASDLEATLQKQAVAGHAWDCERKAG